MPRAYGVTRLMFTAIKCHKHFTEVHKILDCYIMTKGISYLKSIHYLLIVLQEDSGIVLDEIVARKVA